MFLKILAKVIRFLSLRIVIFVIAVLLGIGGTLLYIQKFGISSQRILQNIAKAEENKIFKDIFGKVNKLIVLPTDEEPVIATINDVDLLIKEQPFYIGAQNGDIVLMYQKALKAIIYSPSRNIIVNVGPITYESNNESLQKVESEEN